MSWGIRRSPHFSSLFEFGNSKIRLFLDLQYRSILLAEKELGVQASWGRVLDFGAGSQDLRQRIAFDEYCTVDPFFPATWKTIKDLPESERFDFIAAVEVFEHLKSPSDILQRLSAHQVKGQKIYLTTPFLAREHGAPEDFQRWTEDGLKELLANAGYRVEKIVRRGGLMAVISSCLNYSLFRLLSTRYFIFGLLLAPVVVFTLAVAHLRLGLHRKSPFYLGLSVLASRDL